MLQQREERGRRDPFLGLPTNYTFAQSEALGGDHPMHLGKSCLLRSARNRITSKPNSTLHFFHQNHVPFLGRGGVLRGHRPPAHRHESPGEQGHGDGRRREERRALQKARRGLQERRRVGHLTELGELNSVNLSANVLEMKKRPSQVKSKWPSFRHPTATDAPRTSS